MVVILNRFRETQSYVVYGDFRIPNSQIIYFPKEELSSATDGKGYPDKIEVTVEAKLG